MDALASPRDVRAVPLRALERQPTTVRISHADDIETETVHVHAAGTHTPQHAHVYDHTTVVVRGSIEVWVDGTLKGVFCAVDHVHIPAGIMHRFVSLEPDTVYCCVHNVSRSGKIEIAAEHQLEGVS